MNDLEIYVNEMPVFDSDRVRFFASFRTPPGHDPIPYAESGTFYAHIAAERRVALDDLLEEIGNRVRGSVLDSW